MINFQHRFSHILVVSYIVPLILIASCSQEQSIEEDHEEHEGHIELTEKQFNSAKIEVFEAKAGRVSEVLTLPGVVQPNADAVLHITPRVAGQVREVFKHLGATVEAGDLLCVLDSVELGNAVADFLSDQANLQASEETLARERDLYIRRLKALTTVLDGAIKVQENIYKREEELQEKAVSTVRPFLEAEKSLQLSKLEKDKQLTELEAERDARLLSLEVDVRSKRIALTAANNRLRTLGLTDEDMGGLNEESSLVSGEYRITSPSAGVVTGRHVSPGEYAQAGTKLFIVQDLSSIWFVASAFETQLQSVRNGQPARVSLDAFPGKRLSGTVSFVDYRVDPTSRSVGVRVELSNEKIENWPEGLPFRPGMFGRVELETTARLAKVILPERALVHDDEGDYVFVQIEPLAFERRDVTANKMAGEMVEVTSGLVPGEVIAVSGTFFLKSVERQSELGGGHGH